MTVLVRTNRITNPKSATAATNYSAVAGTGGTASGARATASPYVGPGFYRVTWTVGTSAVTGGASYLQTGLSAATQYAFAIVLRCSKTQNITFGVQYQNSSSTNVGSAFQAGGVALVANVWSSPVTITSAPNSGAGVDRAVLTAIATSGFGSNWANGDTLDVGFLFMETGALVGSPIFDGDTPATTVLPVNDVFAWNGTANASTSTDTKRTLALAVSDNSSGGPPQAQAVITDGGPGTYTVQVTRQCEGETYPVQSAVTLTFSDASVVNDTAVPLQRLTTYNVLWQGLVVATATYTQTATAAWISDPLQPDKAIPIQLNGGTTGFLTMDGDSLKEVLYPNNSTTLPIMGARYPVSQGGQPQAASKVPVLLYSDDKATADAFRQMIGNAPILLLRPLVGMDPLPALSYIAREARERGVNRQFGGNIASWTVTGDLVQAVQQAIVSGFVTYQNVQDLITTANTYGMVQTKSAAKTYLDWQKNPRIWTLL